MPRGYPLVKREYTCKVCGETFDKSIELAGHIFSNNRKGKTYEEIYGPEKAIQVKRKASLTLTGRIYREEWKRSLSLSLTGKKKSRESVEKSRQANLGRSSPLKGKTYEEIYGDRALEQRRKVGLGGVGKKKPFSPAAIERRKIQKIYKLLWQDPEYIRKVLKGLQVRPTNAEKRLELILNEIAPDFQYNGDFSLGITIGGKIPDFINTNGEKQIIEMFGDYWHKPIEEQLRKEVFKEYGYDCLVVWENELEHEVELVNKIKEVLYNG